MARKILPIIKSYEKFFVVTYLYTALLFIVLGKKTLPIIKSNSSWWHL